MERTILNLQAEVKRLKSENKSYLRRIKTLHKLIIKLIRENTGLKINIYRFKKEVKLKNKRKVVR